MPQRMGENDRNRVRWRTSFFSNPTNRSRLRKLFVHEVPVDHVPPSRNIIRTAVLIFQVVGVLPHIQRQGAALAHLLTGESWLAVGENLEFSILCHQPRPTAAKTLQRRIVKLLLELVERFEFLLNGLGELARRFASALRATSSAKTTSD